MERKSYTKMALRRHGVVSQVTLGMDGSGNDMMAMMRRIIMIGGMNVEDPND